MFKAALIAFGLVVGAGTAWGAGNFDAGKLHAQFTEAFNARDWDGLKALLADDIVFHRASGQDVFIGPDAVIERFSSTIGAPDQWNVKYAILDSDSKFVGKDGRVVERGDFAVTAGGDDSACYRGSYMMTWVEQSGAGWRLQLLAWQDVETGQSTLIACTPRVSSSWVRVAPAWAVTPPRRLCDPKRDSVGRLRSASHAA